MTCCVCARRDGEPNTCIPCVGQARRDLATILELAAVGEQRLDGWPPRAVGTPSETPRSADTAIPGGDLLVLLSGGHLGTGYGDPDLVDTLEPWEAHGQRPPDLDTQPDDPQPVLPLLATWEDDWRDVRRRAGYIDASAGKATIASASGYLDRHLSWAAQNHDAFDEFATDLREVRARLESALREGPQRSPVPCITCGRRALERAAPRKDGKDIPWRCARCHRSYTNAEFWQAVRDYGQPV